MSTLEARFWAKVDRRGADECWLWTAATNEAGYGVIRPDGRRTGPALRAHRVAAALAGMQIEGLQVRHHCDNPPCVNPAHLVPGTNAQNVADMVERGRQNRGSRNGNATLDERRVTAIRGALLLGWTHLEISSLFNVSRSTVSLISSGRTWKHVTPPAARDIGAAVADFLNAPAVAA